MNLHHAGTCRFCGTAQRLADCDEANERLRAALEQALDRMETAFALLGPDETAHDREAVAMALWFGQEELRAALGVTA